MFIYSVRASTVKFFMVIALTLSVLFGILFIGGAGTVEASNVGIDFEGVKTNEDRIEFIEKFGLSVSEQPCASEEFKIPSEFDRVITEYNEIQKRQGLDLEKYKNKTATRYTYSVTNYEGHDGEVFVNITVHKDRIIACDLSSGGTGGFVLPLVNVAR